MVRYSEGKLPVEPRAIIGKMNNCRLIKYTVFEREKLMKTVDINAKDFFGSDDGCTLYKADRDRYLIFYNDFRVYDNPGRLRWTLAHEIAHVVLSHTKHSGEPVMQRGSKSGVEYDYLEHEADYFAGMLLAYPAVIKACRVKNEIALEDLCGLSRGAAKARFQSLKKSQMKESNVDYLVEKHFHKVIDIYTLPFQIVPDSTQFGW